MRRVGATPLSQAALLMTLRIVQLTNCGFISINAPAGFEQMMPRIVQYLAEQPLGDVTDA